MIDNTNLLDNIEASLMPKEDYRTLAQVFALGEVFRYTDDTDSLIFLQIRARGGSRTSLTLHSREHIIF